MTRTVWMRLTPKGRDRIEGALALRQMSHKTLATKIGWKSHSMVGQLLRGERSTVSAQSGAMICRTLGFDLSDLFLVESSNDQGLETRVAS